MNILITICARGGSKGIPGKNIKILNNKPLIGYTIDIARQFKDKFESVTIALSTDSDEIVKVAKECGLISNYVRPYYLANDSAGKIDAIKDVLLFKELKNSTKYDYILDLDVTSPLRNMEDLEKAFDILKNDVNAINLFSVSNPNRNPYFNVVEQKDNGYYGKVKDLDSSIMTRQSAPEIYDLNASFYFYKRIFFDKGYTGAITDKSLIYLVPHICFDLDHQIDFDIISFLMKSNKLDFKL